MTDTNSTFTAENAVTVGSILSAERLRQGLSVSDTAQNLKLGVKQIEALEADDYAKLPGRTFVRGFVRNYARLLQLDPVPLLAMIETAEPPKQLNVAELAGRTLLRNGYRKKSGMRKYFVWMVLIALIVAAGISAWHYYNNQKPTEIAAPAPLPLPAPAASMPVQAEVTPNLPEPVSPSVTIQPVPTEPAPNVPPAAPAPVLVAPTAPVPAPSLPVKPPEKSVASIPVVEKPVQDADAAKSDQLKFSFTRDSWVQVRDKKGKILFSQLNPAGSEQVIKGKAPFSLIVGNAAHAKLIYNGKPVDLQPYVKIEVARLTLE